MALLSCKISRNLPTMDSVDLNKYAGLWYEVARLPNWFEQGLVCPVANYTLLPNGRIEVLNQGRLVKDFNKIKNARGTAWVPDAQYPGRLKVRFFWPFAGDYYIISVDASYQYALIGAPSRKYLWILSRSKTPDPEIFNRLLALAQSHGFDTSKVMRVGQI